MRIGFDDSSVDEPRLPQPERPTAGSTKKLQTRQTLQRFFRS